VDAWRVARSRGWAREREDGRIQLLPSRPVTPPASCRSPPSSWWRTRRPSRGRWSGAPSGPQAPRRGRSLQEEVGGEQGTAQPQTTSARHLAIAVTRRRAVSAYLRPPLLASVPEDAPLTRSAVSAPVKAPRPCGQKARRVRRRQARYYPYDPPAQLADRSGSCCCARALVPWRCGCPARRP
jgi:hypothetical protein